MLKPSSKQADYITLYFEQDNLIGLLVFIN